ncbi:MAG: PD40 domain-containing protein [bacterium]|nr:PD40 domain-containing protein [Candidatus Kapabacteria bacterium]
MQLRLLLIAATILLTIGCSTSTEPVKEYVEGPLVGRVVYGSHDYIKGYTVYSERADGTDKRKLLDSAMPLSPVCSGRIAVRRTTAANFKSTDRFEIVDLANGVRYDHGAGHGLHYYKVDLTTEFFLLSPDGEIVATRDTATGEVFVARFDGTGRRSLGINAMKGTAPRFSPDGKWLAVGTIGDSFKLQIAGIDHAETRTLAVATEYTLFSGFSWTSDSRTLLYDRSTLAIGRVDIDGSNQSENPASYIASPDIEPNGQRVVCLNLPNSEVVLLNNNGTMRILVQPPVNGGSGSAPRWSPDGKRVLSISYRTSMSIINPVTLEYWDRDVVVAAFWSLE